METAGQQQLSLFAPTNDGEVRAKLMADIDALNRRYGLGTMGFAAALASQGNLRAPWLGSGRGAVAVNCLPRRADCRFQVAWKASD